MKSHSRSLSWMSWYMQQPRRAHCRGEGGRGVGKEHALAAVAVAVKQRVHAGKQRE